MLTTSLWSGNVIVIFEDLSSKKNSNEFCYITHYIDKVIKFTSHYNVLIRRKKMTRDELKKIAESCVGKSLNGANFIPAPDHIRVSSDFVKTAGAGAIVSIISKPFVNGMFKKAKIEVKGK